MEKTSDWYWILGIISIAGASASVIFGNILFAVVILLGATTMVIVAQREPRLIQHEVSAKGVLIGTELHPYNTLESYCLELHTPRGAQLILRTKKLFHQLIVVPIPEEYADELDLILAGRLAEEHLEEPLAHKIMEYLGF